MIRVAVKKFLDKEEETHNEQLKDKVKTVGGNLRETCFGP